MKGGVDEDYAPMKHGRFKVSAVCRTRVRHRHLQDTCPTRIGHSNVVSDFKPP